MVASVRPLKLGVYTVRWQAISADSHVVSGVWTFGVRVPAPSVNDAYGAGGPTDTEHFVRWLWFLGIALTIGALGLRLIVLRGLEVPRELDRKIAVAAGLGAVVALQAGIAAFSLRAEDALQLPFGRFLYGDLSPMADTRFGTAFVTMTLGFALVLALVYLAWLLDRVEFLVPAFVLSLLFAGGLSLSGHDAVDPGSSWKTELADWVHISAASLWIGALATMAGLLWFGAPQLRRAGVHALLAPRDGADRARPRRQGSISASCGCRTSRDLWSQGYGQVLLVKIGLVCVALLWGAFHHFVVRPALDRADTGFLSRIGRSLVGESLVGRRRAARRGDPRRLAAAGEADRNFEYVGPDGRICGDTPAVKILVARIVAARRGGARHEGDVGEPTYGLASGGGSVWVGGLGSGDVLRIDPRLGQGPRVASRSARASSTSPRRRARSGRSPT